MVYSPIILFSVTCTSELFLHAKFRVQLSENDKTVTFSQGIVNLYLFPPTSESLSSLLMSLLHNTCSFEQTYNKYKKNEI